MMNATHTVKMTDGFKTVTFKMVKGIKGATLNGRSVSTDEALAEMTRRREQGWWVVTRA